MTAPAPTAKGVELVLARRADQGLPKHLTDPASAARVAALLERLER